MLRIGLASYEFRNNALAFNLSQIEKALQAVQGKVDLLCFGETFLQGFDALNWDYEHDKDIAIPACSATMERLCRMTVRYQTDLLFGYFEKDRDAIYSSCAVLEKGNLLYNYRRVSRGWKEYAITDGHYREGTEVSGFSYHGQWLTLALCGDLWEFPERFRTDGLLIWPVYVNFSPEEWAGYEEEYAVQASLAADRALMVNSISHNPESVGGAFCFAGGKTERKAAFGEETVLLVELP